VRREPGEPFYPRSAELQLDFGQVGVGRLMLRCRLGLLAGSIPSVARIA
jgi:hypothetical protein